MHPDIDAIRIHFDESQMSLMYFCLAFIMFGIAIDMTLEDFKRVVQYPKAVLIGLASQWLILPIITVYLIHAWNPVPSMALGLLLIAACPGGNISNYATYLSKGNAALSVTMTSVVTVLSFIVTPISFSGYAFFVPQVQGLLAQIDLDAWKMLIMLVKLILIPLMVGMTVNYYWPDITSRIKKSISRLSLLIFAGFILAAVLGNLDNMMKHLKLVFWLVILHNFMAMAAGYFWAKWNRLPEADARAITMETGIQNSGLGLVFVFNFFPQLGGMMLIVAFWAIWDLISSFVLGLYWSKHPIPQEKNSTPDLVKGYMKGDHT